MKRLHPKLAVCLVRLASAHHHEWVSWLPGGDLAAQNAAVTADPEAAFAAAGEALEAAIAAKSDPTGPGPWPSCVRPPKPPCWGHSTGTGRLAWWVPYPTDELKIEVSRPGLIGGGYTVARAIVLPREEGERADWRYYITADLMDAITDIDARPGHGAHLRHLAALHHALSSAVDPVEADWEDMAYQAVALDAGDPERPTKYHGGTAAELLARLSAEIDAQTLVGKEASE